jgi:hypothetical protein
MSGQLLRILCLGLVTANQSPKKIAVTVTVAPALALPRAVAEAEAEATTAVDIADKYIPRSFMSQPPCLQTRMVADDSLLFNKAGIYKHMPPSVMYNSWG